jgi:hypothetical protein
MQHVLTGFVAEFFKFYLRINVYYLLVQLTYSGVKFNYQFLQSVTTNDSTSTPSLQVHYKRFDYKMRLKFEEERRRILSVSSCLIETYDTVQPIH